MALEDLDFPELESLDLDEIADGREVPQDVREEWEAWLKSNYAVNWTNNFLGYFPNGYRRRWLDGSLEAGVITREAFEASMNSRPVEDPAYPLSQHRASQTLREFHEMLDALLIEFGIDDVYAQLIAESDMVNMGRLEVMLGDDENAKSSMKQASAKVTDRIRILLMPIYWRLRIMGYKRYKELIA